jgi:hypothetical protein
MPSRVGVSLGTKLIIAAVLLLAAAIGTSAIYGLRTLDSLARSYADSRRAEHEGAMKRETELVVRNVVLTAGLPLGESNYTYLQNLARSTVAENRNIAWIVVADSITNRVVARTDNAPPGEVLDDALSPELRKAPASSEVYSQRSTTDPDHIVFGAIISVGDQRVGEVRLSLDISELQTASWQRPRRATSSCSPASCSPSASCSASGRATASPARCRPSRRRRARSPAATSRRARR